MTFTSDPIVFPVFGLRSKRGKLLLETSSLIRCPLKNTMLVGQSSIWISFTCSAVFFSNAALSRHYEAQKFAE
jgi:hypothetical protein